MLLYVFVASAFMPILALPFAFFDFSKRKHAAVCALLIGLACASIGLGFHHVAEGDITRYVATVDSYGSLTLGEALQSNLKSSPVAVLWFWVLGHIGIPDALPATEMFIDYSILAYIILDSSVKKKWSFGELLIATIGTLSVFPLFFAISAVRSTTAMMIGTLAAYRDLVNEKRNLVTLALYIFPVFIHGAAALILVCRLVCLIPKVTPVRAFLIGVGLFGFVIAFNEYLTPLSRLLHTDIVDRLMYYTEWNTGYAERVSTSSYYIVLKRLHWCFIGSLLFDYATRSKSHDSNDRFSSADNFIMVGVGCILVLSIIIQVPSYTRFTYGYYPLAVISIIEKRFKPKCSDGNAIWQLIYAGFSAAFFAIFTFALLHFMVIPDLINGILFGVLGPMMG